MVDTLLTAPCRSRYWGRYFTDGTYVGVWRGHRGVVRAAQHHGDDWGLQGSHRYLFQTSGWAGMFRMCWGDLEPSEELLGDVVLALGVLEGQVEVILGQVGVISAVLA